MTGRQFPTTLRSRAWFDNPANVDMTSLYLERYPESFVPAAGAWGRRGSTLVRLAAADPKILAPALKFACAHSASPPTRKRPATAGRRST